MKVCFLLVMFFEGCLLLCVFFEGCFPCGAIPVKLVVRAARSEFPSSVAGLLACRMSSYGLESTLTLMAVKRITYLVEQILHLILAIRPRSDTLNSVAV